MSRFVPLPLSLFALTLGACAPTVLDEPPADGQAPVAEAFTRYDSRLNLPEARVGFDEAGCALYVATGPDGQPYREAMLTPDGQSICNV